MNPVKNNLIIIASVTAICMSCKTKKTVTSNRKSDCIKKIREDNWIINRKKITCPMCKIENLSDLLKVYEKGNSFLADREKRIKKNKGE